MTGGRIDSLALDDEDRLPWLEPAYEAEPHDEVSLARLALFVLAGLVLIGLVVGGVYLVRGQLGGGGAGELVKAPAENYKIPAADADAKKFQGEGDASFAASEGIERGGRIDPSRLPEAPIVGGSVAKAPAADKSAASAAAKKVETAVADRTGEKAQAPAASAAAQQGGGAIQLGAYGNEALARDAWSRFSKRFTYLADLSHSIQPVTVGGTKFYRLRAHAGKEAGTLCGKLKVAGESCLVVN
ncbi:MAG: SPOR domain-containing protein [Sphingobium sp.]